MSLLTVTEIGQTALEMDAALVAAALAGDQYPNDERTFFCLKNASGVTVTATIAATRATADKYGFGELGVDDITIAVPTMKSRVVRAPVASHGDAAGRVTVTYSAVATVTVGAFRLARH